MGTPRAVGSARDDVAYRWRDPAKYLRSLIEILREPDQPSRSEIDRARDYGRSILEIRQGCSFFGFLADNFPFGDRRELRRGDRRDVMPGDLADQGPGGFG